MAWKVSGTLPPSAEPLKGHSRAIWVATANAALHEYGAKDEGRVIATAHAAVNKYKEKLKAKASVKKSFVQGIMDWIDNAFGATKREAPATVEQVSKSVDKEQRRAMFVVLEPLDETTADLHEDTYTLEEVEKACIDFNTHCQVANLFHRVDTENAVIEQSFIAPADFTTDEGVNIKKGTWLQWWHFPEGNAQSDVLWQMVKDHDIQGVSVSCKATVEKLND